jgi:hypothetical protein
MPKYRRQESNLKARENPRPPPFQRDAPVPKELLSYDQT